MSLWLTIEGLLPFGGDTPEDVLTAIGERGAGPRRLTIPDGLRAVLWRGLAVEPSERYPDMHALVRALDAVIRPPPTSRSDGPPASLEPGPSSGRSASGEGWRGAFFVVTMLLIGAVVFGALSLRDGVWERGGGPEAPPRPLAPAPLPAPPCAVSGAAGLNLEIDDSVRGICILIRQGAVREAGALWDKEHLTREPPPGSAPSRGSFKTVSRMWSDLAAQTLVVAQTLVDQAEATQFSDRNAAYDAARAALLWITTAKDDLDQARMMNDASEPGSEANSQALYELTLEIADVQDRAIRITQQISN
ncbi:hypothetical protein [Enhygromyxa salina]|uniref:hypothetical protein n=1 Tax=Enhygromyxa salina TaxID=215803 RepID=UPI0006973E46|nr:hypothetical protein [Enhygromyxa salina]